MHFRICKIRTGLKDVLALRLQAIALEEVGRLKDVNRILWCNERNISTIDEAEY